VVPVNADDRQLLAAAQLAADRAAAYLRREEGRLAPAAWSEKGRADFVTEVDRESERLIAETLVEAAPGSVVVGEELTPDRVSSGLCWVVDPLDGTTNYLHRFPYYAVSIAALVEGEPVAGLVHHVPPGIRYHAVRGGGAFQDGTPIHVSRVTDPRHALIGTGFPFKYVDQLPRYQAQFAAVLSSAAGLRRPGSAALDLCDVAAGRFDGFWELVLAPWDVAAGTLIVREAGGLVTGLDGDPHVIRHGSIVAGNPVIHAWLLELLNAPSLHPTP
jgi:myo-inositol-1(or 4)-monophosphatase